MADLSGDLAEGQPIVKYTSLCSGIGAPEQAWKDLGWECQFHAEIESFPSAVYAHHFASPNLGDISQFKQWKDYGQLDLIVGGTPCQSFSVAGLRSGLADPRGNLALTFLAVVERYAPRWVVWENVPGVHSCWSDAQSCGSTAASREIGEANRRAAIEAGFDAQTAGHFADVVEVDQTSDFDQFIAALEQLGYGVATGILDAQYFGVPQRRERVFVVGHIGGQWQRAAAVLFERESLCGHPPPSREAGQRTAPTVAGCSNGGGANGPGRDVDSCESLAPMTAKPLGGHHPRTDLDNETYVMAHGQANAEIVSDGEPSLTCNRESPICIQSVNMARERKQNGIGVSNAGAPMYSLTGRDQHAVGFKESRFTRGKDDAPSEVVPPLSADADKGDQDTLVFDTTQVTSKGNYSNPQPGDACHPLASQAHPPAIAISFQPRFFTRDNKTGGAASCGDQVAALSANHGGGDSAPHVAIGFDSQQSGDTQQQATVDGTPPIRPKNRNAVAFTERTREGGRRIESQEDLSYALTNPGKGGRTQERNVAGNFGVRRLLPVECEKLQGFPPGFTAIKYKGKIAADSLRYRALGNSMAVPVLSWIGQRIKFVDTLASKP